MHFMHSLNIVKDKSFPHYLIQLYPFNIYIIDWDYLQM